jgi:hypothetical protein
MALVVVVAPSLYGVVNGSGYATKWPIFLGRLEGSPRWAFKSTKPPCVRLRKGQRQDTEPPHVGIAYKRVLICFVGRDAACKHVRAADALVGARFPPAEGAASTAWAYA